ncbi:MAG TPA: DUF6325 family protein [Galbitalea sp.]|jgi:hypothetical protein
MTLGPIEIVTIVFPGSKFTGQIVPELAKVVDNDTITVVDGLFVSIGLDGATEYVEFDELDANDDAARLNSVVDHIEGLISEDDVAELTESLEPGSSAAILVFEHTWMKPLRDAVADSGGIVLDSIRVPGAVVDEVLDAVSQLS